MIFQHIDNLKQQYTDKYVVVDDSQPELQRFRGLTGTVKLPLELLVLADPDLVVAGDGSYRAPALATEAYAHPAFRALAGEAVASPGQYWICGAPFTVEAARRLQDAALAGQGLGK